MEVEFSEQPYFGGSGLTGLGVRCVSTWQSSGEGRGLAGPGLGSSEHSACAQHRSSSFQKCNTHQQLCTFAHRTPRLWGEPGRSVGSALHGRAPSRAEQLCGSCLSLAGRLPNPGLPMGQEGPGTSGLSFSVALDLTLGEKLRIMSQKALLGAARRAG